MIYLAWESRAIDSRKMRSSRAGFCKVLIKKFILRSV